MSDDGHYIATVAKALCELDGIDTTVPIPAGELEPVITSEGITIVRKLVQPGWKAREAEATRLVTAIRALGLLK